MPKIITQGECLIDLVFEKDHPIHAIAGGSMLNAAISLGRVGAEVEFIGEYANDMLGTMITEVLEENNVGHRWSLVNTNGQTSLAIAWLDERKNATYNFYHKLTDGQKTYPSPSFEKGDFFLFGSSFAVKNETQDWLNASLSQLQEKQCILYYDLNLRTKHLNEVNDLHAKVERNMHLSSIVKGSDEDFMMMYRTHDFSSLYAALREHCPVLIISAGSKDLMLFTPGETMIFKVPVIEPVSTIGAGDNLNAGILYALSKLRIQSGQLLLLNRETWEIIINTGIEFATACCLNSENYLPKGFKPAINQ